MTTRSVRFPALIAAAVACSPGRAAPVAGQPADLAVRAARVLDVRSGQYSDASVVLVSGTRITSVIPASRFDARTASRVVDVGDMAIIPGLIDAHVHLTIGGPVRANALADLRAGFTTVADQGALTVRLLASTHRMPYTAR